MINDIKMDKIYSASISANVQDNVKPQATPALEATQDGVTVTNHLSALVNLMDSDHDGDNDSSRVQEMKERIQANTYQINYSALSDVLLKKGIV